MPRKHFQSKHPSSQPVSHRGHKTSKRNLAWLWISLGALFVALVGILLIKPRNTPSVDITPALANSPSVAITPAQAYAKYQQGVFFLDVRTQAEWNQSHLAKSTLIPLDQLQNRLSELPKDQDIVVICLSGHRSQSGVAILQQAGFTRVSYVSGGLQAWIAAGYPVQGTAP
jgi:rhodanese-related sulfurtransferase